MHRNPIYHYGAVFYSHDVNFFLIYFNIIIYYDISCWNTFIYLAICFIKIVEES